MTGAVPRRAVLRLAALAPLVLAIPAAAEEVPCYDPATLPFSQRSRRRALGYVDKAPDPAKRCGLCAFFSATGGRCGTCQMLGGAAVDAGAVCDSFAAKKPPG